MADRESDGSVRTARLKRPAPILVCGKCLGRVPDGKALRRALKRAAKAAAGDGRPARVVRTSCLGICPKGAALAASAATLASGEVLLLRGEGDVPAAMTRLLGAPDAQVPQKVR